VVPGASGGIVAAAARMLNAQGDRVAVVGRDPQKTAAVARAPGADNFVADFTALDEVRRLAADLYSVYPRIDVLANSAGGVFDNNVATVDGFETTFQVNHLAPYLLTPLLTDKLIASRASVLRTTTIRGGLVNRLNLDRLDHVTDSSPIRS
jgi:NAD(P)-dependent dehydrogenase (short-subunit alcohol dehydrogenase family)